MTRSHMIALGILAVVAIWLASGLFRADTVQQNHLKEKRLPKVKVERSVAQDHPVLLIARGFTEADRKVSIRSEVSGRVVKIYKDDGEYVKQGEPLIELSLRDKQAKMDEAKAMVKQRDLEYRAAKKLNEKDFRSDTALAFAEAQLNEAQAQMAAIQREIDDTVVSAPFDGILESREVEKGTFADVGDVLCTVVDLDPLLAVLDISEAEVQSISLGMKARVRLTRGDELEGTVSYISRVADPGTRTFRVEISIPNPEDKIPDGLSLEAGIPIENKISHGVSPAILTLNTSGQIGVKIIDEENTVKFVPVTLADSTTELVWVTGLPEDVGLIVTGQEFVSEGQVVEPVWENRDAQPD